MTDKEEQSLKETERKKKRLEEEAEGLAKEQGRKKVYLIREEATEKALKAKKTKRTEKQATKDIEQLARDQTRKKAYLAKEQAMAEAQEARKLKAKKQSRG
jgi:hypothetical protein